LTAFVVMTLLMGLWVTARRVADASAGGGPGGGHYGPGCGRGRALETVAVGRRDTLWGIASRHRPGVDPRITVQRIIDLNGLPGVIVQPGQELRLPCG
jgi:hypothetical protein